MSIVVHQKVFDIFRRVYIYIYIYHKYLMILMLRGLEHWMWGSSFQNAHSQLKMRRKPHEKGLTWNARVRILGLTKNKYKITEITVVYFSLRADPPTSRVIFVTSPGNFVVHANPRFQKCIPETNRKKWQVFLFLQPGAQSVVCPCEFFGAASACWRAYYDEN